MYGSKERALVTGIIVLYPSRVCFFLSEIGLLFLPSSHYGCPAFFRVNNLFLHHHAWNLTAASASPLSVSLYLSLHSSRFKRLFNRKQCELCDDMHTCACFENILESIPSFGMYSSRLGKYYSAIHSLPPLFLANQIFVKNVIVKCCHCLDF